MSRRSMLLLFFSLGLIAIKEDCRLLTAARSKADAQGQGWRVRDIGRAIRGGLTEKNGASVSADNPRRPAKKEVSTTSSSSGSGSGSGSGNGNDTNESFEDGRRKRYSKDYWIDQDFEGHDNLVQIQALVVRDEDITGCRATASDVTNSRYFMCSGAILTARHVITTASCVHFAHVYEHHIEADLAVLVGALYQKSYVIKVGRFEMHPRYVYDADSPLYSRHNLAILFLDCPIPRVARSLPRLPSGEYEDVGHLCCPQACEVMTVVQKWTNRHEARLIKPLHLPAPTHETINEEEFVLTATESPYKRACKKRERRTPAKLAPTPVFFSNDRKNSMSPITRVPKAMQENDSSAPAGARRKLGEPELDEAVEAEEAEKPNGETAAGEELLPVNLDAIEQAPLPENLSETNRAAVSNFTKNIVDVALRKLNEMLEEDVGTRPTSYLGQKNMSMEGFANVLARTIVTTTLNDLNLTDYRLDQLNAAEPPSDIYRKCPPLGAPLVLDDLLVGLVAYTCDDLQDWVPWQYVSLSKNLGWIREKISAETGDAASLAEDGDDVVDELLDELVDEAGDKVGGEDEHVLQEKVPASSENGETSNGVAEPLDQYIDPNSKLLPFSSKTNVNVNQCFVDEQGVTRCATRIVIKDEN